MNLHHYLKGNILISPEWLGICPWNLSNVNKISLETFWHSKVWNRQVIASVQTVFLNTHNILFKFHMKKVTSIFWTYWHGMKLKLTVKITLDWLVSHGFCHVIFSGNSFWSVNYTLAMWLKWSSHQGYQWSKFQLYLEVEISGGTMCENQNLLTKSWVLHGYEILNANKECLILLLYQFSRLNFPHQTSSVLNFLVLCFSG